MPKLLFTTTKGDGYTDLHDSGIPSRGTSLITFEVQACSDAYIKLSPPIKGENNTIVIELGRDNNKLSCIQVYPQGECSAKAQEVVLDCREYRLFTVDWGDGQIRVKKGDPTAPKSNIFLSLSLKYNLDDVKVGISTRCESSGNWSFEGIGLFV